MTDTNPAPGNGAELPDLDLFRARAAQPGLTPMMRTYFDLRVQCDGLMGFLMGDFLEFFFEDAEIVSRVCNVALTRRRETPMAGLPVPFTLDVTGRVQRTPWLSGFDLVGLLVKAGYPVVIGGHGRILARVGLHPETGVIYHVEPAAGGSSTPEAPSVLPVGLPAGAGRSGHDPAFVALVGKWAAALARDRSDGAAAGTDDLSPQRVALFAVEDEIQARPCLTSADLALRFLADTESGRFQASPEFHALCLGLVGLGGARC